ncbi:hypothetical protein CIB84_012642 [Bambusicola thoracicus]|uniref:Phosphatidylinositol-3-phosphatase SAC1 n=1 Tax=Bambusicola thoracicus TaxID=9083 RepID=A0A2P4SHL3_BAMTH|nr:hypothetical protein CIB84_012642 [Bambusicola thoracicus]
MGCFTSYVYLLFQTTLLFFWFTGTYLIVITKKKKVGEIFSHAIWKATDFDILSYKKTMLHLTDIQLQDNKVFLSMISHVLSVDGFYFSTTYDLTHTLQRLANTSPEFQEMSLLERVRISCCFLSVSDVVS